MSKHVPIIFPLVLFGYSIFSFSQTDPNLVLSSHPQYLEFQRQMWIFGFHMRPIASFVFSILTVILFIGYGLIIRAIKNGSLTNRKAVVIFCLSIAALLPSYPALSHDIFNYIFNAKMVTVYGGNPHVNVALDYPDDPWLSFMHNTHTPAPYGYGWTIFSLIPYYLGRGYLQLELLVFRLVMAGSLFLCLYLLKKIENVESYKLALLAFNPLILIEIVGNIHNDLVMMAAALTGFVALKSGINQKKRLHVCFAVMAFAFSVSIKFASIALIGAMLAAYFIKRINLVQWSVLAMLSPLLTNRSQRFLPWYLSWALVFLPLLKNQVWVNTLITASFAGLISYCLIIYSGEYSPGLLILRSWLLFGLPSVYFMFQSFLRKAYWR